MLTVMNPATPRRQTPRTTEKYLEREYAKLAYIIRQVVYIMDSSSTSCIGSAQVSEVAHILASRLPLSVLRALLLRLHFSVMWKEMEPIPTIIYPTNASVNMVSCPCWIQFRMPLNPSHKKRALVIVCILCQPAFKQPWDISHVLKLSPSNPAGGSNIDRFCAVEGQRVVLDEGEHGEPRCNI